MIFIHKNDHIYQNNDKGEIIAEVRFPKIGEVVEINRTFVDESLRGQGIANLLLMEAYQSIKLQNLKAIPTCSYAITWFRRNKDKRDILVESIDLENLKEECGI